MLKKRVPPLQDARLLTNDEPSNKMKQDAEQAETENAEHMEAEEEEKNTKNEAHMEDWKKLKIPRNSWNSSSRNLRKERTTW